MPPKKATHTAAAAAAASPASPAPQQSKRLSSASTAPSTPVAAAAAATAAAASSVPSFVFRSDLCPGDVSAANSLFMMLRGIYQYLQQFGFQSVAEELHAQCQERYPDDDRPLSVQDTQEGELRFHLWNVYTLTASAAVGPLHETAVVALDSLQLLITLSCISHTAGSAAFNAQVKLKAAACLSALRDGGDELFNECLDQFFPSADAAEVEGGNERACSAATTDALDRRLSQGAKLSDDELRGYRLFTTRRQLLVYAQNTAQLATLRAKAPLAAVLRKQLSDVDKEYARDTVQEACYETIRSIMEALHCDGSTLLETIAKAIATRDWEALTVKSKPPQQQQETEEGEEEESGADNGAVEVIASDGEVVEDDEMNGGNGTPIVEEPEDDEAPEVEEEEEEEEEAAPVPVKRRPGRPTKAEAAARAAAATAPATPKIRAPLSMNAPVPEVARNLQAASDKLKSATKSVGRDPLTEALRATQTLSKAAPAPAAAASEEAEEDVEVEEEEEEEEAPAAAAAAAAAPAPKKRGRPAKAAKKQAAYEAKYDREDKHAVKIQFTEDEAEDEGKEDTAADDDDEPMVLPAFTAKKRVLDKGALDAGAAAAAASPKPASKLSQIMDASQRSRPIPHRHKEDRSVRRVPWSTEEIQKLTDGVVEFAAEHKKWSMILNKYGEFFQDRTVVDLKDKWRNLKSKLGTISKGKAKGSKRKADADGEVEEIED